MNVTSDCDVKTTHTKYKCPPYATDRNHNNEKFLRTPLLRTEEERINKKHSIEGKHSLTNLG